MQAAQSMATLGVVEAVEHPAQQPPDKGVGVLSVRAEPHRLSQAIETDVRTAGSDQYLLVGEWARWASTIVETWPDDPRQAKPDPKVIAEIVRRAADGSSPSASSLSDPAPERH